MIKNERPADRLLAVWHREKEKRQLTTASQNVVDTNEKGRTDK